jgi:leucyl aminopeptidase
MKIKLTLGDVLHTEAQALAFATFEFSKAPAGESLFAQADAQSGGQLSKAAKAEAFTGAEGSSLELKFPAGFTGAKLFTAGLGKPGAKAFGVTRAFAANAVRAAERAGAGSVEIALPGPDAGSLEDQLRAAVEGALLADYRFDKYLSKKPHAKRPEPRVTAVSLNLSAFPDAKPTAKNVKAAFDRAVATAEGILIARDLVNEPANVIYPESLAKFAQDTAKKLGNLTVEVLDEKQAAKKGLNLLLAVGQAAKHQPRFIVISYRPKLSPKAAKSARHPVLLGKGLTFDSGGLSIKPGDSMYGMKVDMGGGASVIGAMYAIAKLAPDYPVTGLIAAAENAIAGNATRPGDVIVGYGGKSVEINNTDAEGRLVLADGLAYAQKDLKPAPTELVDIATLTGACMVALGPTTSGLFSDHDDLAESLLAASKRAGEDVWRMPLTKGLKKQLKSDCADMKNTGARWGGAITAGLFLQEFAGDLKWAHLDIAGPVTSESEDGHLRKGASGHPVATLVQFVVPTA